MDTFALREAFSKMRDLVRTGKWRRDYLKLDGQYCMVGMVNMFPFRRQVDLLALLDRSIEPEELAFLKDKNQSLPRDVDGYRTFNGGKIRSFTTSRGRIATYNNTRDGEQDILAWLDRAEQLAYEPEKKIDLDELKIDPKYQRPLKV